MQQAVLSASPRASLATAHLVGANSGDPIDNADGVVTPDGCADGRVRLPAEKMRTAAEFAGLNIGSVVDRGGFQSHEWKRVERLEAVRELAKPGAGSSASVADSGLADAVTKPKRRESNV
ncbi:MAG: hypothetical protein WAX29_02725 [Propionibacterium sp.]